MNKNEDWFLYPYHHFVADDYVVKLESHIDSIEHAEHPKPAENFQILDSSQLMTFSSESRNLFGIVW